MFVVENPQQGQRSLEEMFRGKNVFVWSLRETCLSWCVDEDFPMTICTLYSWICRTLAAEGSSRPERPETAIDYTFVLFPVQVERFSDGGLSHFKFQRCPGSVGLNPKSRRRVSPGDYALYRPDGSIPQTYYQFLCDIPFSHWEREYADLQPDVVVEASITSQLVDAVLLRDGLRCVLTGIPLTEQMDVVWVIPPYMSFLLIKDDYKKRELVRKQTYYGSTIWETLGKVPYNCLTICKDLVHLFQDNEVGIDVDDDYRIVVFRGRSQLPPHLKNDMKTHVDMGGSRDPRLKEFLQCHFEQCLAAHTVGTPVRIDAPHCDAIFRMQCYPYGIYTGLDPLLTFVNHEDDGIANVETEPEVVTLDE